MNDSSVVIDHLSTPELYPLRTEARENYFLLRDLLLDPEKRKRKNMLDLKPQYIVSDENEPVSVILDIQTFRKIEAVIEDYGLAQFMDEGDGDELLSLSEARDYYINLKKSS